MKVRIAQEARLDMEAIGDWIAEENPSRATSFVDQLQERCRSLAYHPRRFPVFRNIDGVEVRKLSYRGYVILYFILDDVVEVVQVIHGARDVMSLFDELNEKGRPVAGPPFS